LGARRYITESGHNDGPRSPHYRLIKDVISEEEEATLIEYISSLLKRKRYEGEHWDSVIVRYKELELHEGRVMPEGVHVVLDRLAKTIKDAYERPVESLQPPHVIDLDSAGRIGPHVDSIKHSGGVLCGLSLMSSRIMQLAPEESSIKDGGDGGVSYFHLPPRSLYFLEGPLRYTYTHSILGKDDYDSENPVFADMASSESQYRSAVGRRLSVIFRDHPV
jgi:alkylated DNA repair protein alkB family protein 7